MAENLTKRPNDPEQEKYGSPRPAFKRGTGGTKSEKYLVTLCDRSFLNLWSFPNAFIDKKSSDRGDGKELCDLLVVCGDHVLIFSDKTVAWPEGIDYDLAWRRWYKRAVKKSIDQIRGAERWIDQFPERIFLDPKCTQRLPIAMPPPERRIVHGIAVALGAGNACIKHFGEGIGSLMIIPSAQGDAHWKGDTVAPFVIGDVDPLGSFIHVFDDATLDIVLRELDTITDFTMYLSKKEALIRSGNLVSAGGEEDLVAYYMTHTNSKDQHDFTRPDGKSLQQTDRVVFQTGLYADMVVREQFSAKREADRSSYAWDRLIEAFTTSILEGTIILPEGEALDFSDIERGVRHMALVPRFFRRMYGEGILDALSQGRKADRFIRAFLPDPRESIQDTAFVFMTVAVPTIELAGGYSQYRNARRHMLKICALALLRRHERLKQVIGIATEPPSEERNTGSSEDLVVAEAPPWTSELLSYLEEQMSHYGILQQTSYAEYAVHADEWPKVPRITSGRDPSHLNRRQRRALIAAERKRNRKNSRSIN